MPGSLLHLRYGSVKCETRSEKDLAARREPVLDVVLTSHFSLLSSAPASSRRGSLPRLRKVIAAPSATSAPATTPPSCDGAVAREASCGRTGRLYLSGVSSSRKKAFRPPMSSV